MISVYSRPISPGCIAEGFIQILDILEVAFLVGTSSVQKLVLEWGNPYPAIRLGGLAFAKNREIVALVSHVVAATPLLIGPRARGSPASIMMRTHGVLCVEPEAAAAASAVVDSNQNPGPDRIYRFWPYLPSLW